MKLLVAIVFTIVLFSAINAQAQEDVTVRAKITEIDTQIRGRQSYAMATVNYTTKEGKQYTSKVRILSIPFVGTSKKVGDSIVITYNTENPYLVKSKSEGFLQTYGIYILIFLGIIAAWYNFKKRKPKAV